MDKNIRTMVDHKWGMLLICSLALLMGPAFASPTSRKIYITYLESAKEKGAVCLDGSSPPAYYYDKGFGDGANKWIVYLEGGYWCITNEECYNQRWWSSLGGAANTYRRWNRTTFEGILSGEQDINPDFYNWNRVQVLYCDGALFSGDMERTEQVVDKNNTYTLYNRGARIYKAVIDDLLEKGMKNAEDAILTGGSAGGLSTILHCDGFRSALPNTKRVKCIADSGFFIHAPTLPGAVSIRESRFTKLVETHGLLKALPSTCTSKMAPGLCLFPENIVGDIQTPLFLVDSLFDSFQLGYQLETPKGLWSNCTTFISTPEPSLCASNQTLVQLAQGFRTEFLKALPKGGSVKMFIDTCVIHCHTTSDTRWTQYTLKNTSIAKAIGDWYFDRNDFSEIDMEHDYMQKCF